MMETNWLPGLVTLGVGAAAGGTWLLVSRLRGSAPRPAAPAQDEDTQAYQQRIEQLRALELERPQLGEARYLEERGRLEQEAAALLRARAARAPRDVAPAPSREAEPPAPGRSRLALGLGWAVALALVVTAFVQLKDAGERAPEVGAQAAAPVSEGDPEMAALLQHTAQHPEDIEAMAAASHELLRRQRYDEAEALTARVLAQQPMHLESHIHRAVVQGVRGDPQGAMQKLTYLADNHPQAHEALLFRGVLALNNDNPTLALESFERFAAGAPEQAAPLQLDHVIAMLKSRSEAAK
jgi:tetratricopeptide (TPR) repeat protein